jgi:Spy/CpxP family protein refolding chaperone
MKLQNVLASAMLGSALLAGSALAQPGGGGRQPGGFGGGMFGMPGFGGGLTLMLGQNKQLQEELKLDKEQIDKINETLGKAMESARDELFPKLRDASPEERTELLKKMMETNTKAVEGALKPEQIKRLHQIENQQAGVGMYSKAEVQSALKLTEEQKGKIDKIDEDYKKDLRDLGAGGGPGGFGGGRGGFGRGVDPQMAKKQEALKKDAVEKINDVLDDGQRSALKDLTGEPFELQRAAFGFGGGQGGGGGFGGGGGGGFGGFGRPGQILPPNLQDTLKLTDEQKKQVEELQKETEAKLQKILTEEQNKQLKDLQSGPRRGGLGGRGPGGPGGDR